MEMDRQKETAHPKGTDSAEPILDSVTFTTFYADNAPYLQTLSIELPLADWFELEAQPFFRELMEYLRKIETQESSKNLGVERD